MKIDDIKLKLENLGYEFESPNHSKIGCSIIGEKEYKVIICRFKNYSYALYEFEEESGANEYFKNWSEIYKEVSETQYEENNNLKYKKVKQRVMKDGYYYVVIKKENLVFLGNEFWKHKNKLENLLEKINYLK